MGGREITERGIRELSGVIEMLRILIGWLLKGYTYMCGKHKNLHFITCKFYFNRKNKKIQWYEELVSFVLFNILTKPF